MEGHLWQKNANWGYGSVKTSGAEVLDLYDEFAGMLKTFVANGCSAAVYTQTTDVEIEVNGLMTYDRKVVKLEENRIGEVSQRIWGALKK